MDINELNIRFFFYGFFMCAILMPFCFFMYSALSVFFTKPNYLGHVYGYRLRNEEQKDFDFLYEKTRLKAHHLHIENDINYHLKLVDDTTGTARKIEAIINRYSNKGYFYTNEKGEIFGRVYNVQVKHERVNKNRSGIRLIVDNTPTPSA